MPNQAPREVVAGNLAAFDLVLPESCSFCLGSFGRPLQWGPAQHKPLKGLGQPECACNTAVVARGAH